MTIAHQPKSGIKTELVSLVHDHVSGDFIFGHKILVMGYWDGLSFYPLDFSLHREKGSQAGDLKKRLTTANKRLSVQHRVVKECRQALKEVRKIFKLIKKENKNRLTKTAKKQIGTAKNRAIRAKQKLKTAETKYVELENKAIELRTELKEVSKRHPDYGLTKKQMSKQFKKHRDIGTPGEQRAAGADIKKTAMMVTMLKRAVKRGFRVEC